MKINKKNILKGSGILVVIFASLATSIYVVSTFADYEHFNTQIEKYKDNLTSMYNKKVENVDNVYNKLEVSIYKTNDYNLE